MVLHSIENIFMSEISGVATKALAIIRIVLPLLCSMKHVALSLFNFSYNGF